jgi:hypothetical protein
MLDDILIPKEGRQVRCISCQHIWRQFLENPAHTSSLPFSDIPFIENSTCSHISGKKPLKWVEKFLFFAITVSFLNFLIFGRNMIMTLWPQSEKGYALLGLSTTLPGAGLSVSNLTSFLQQEGTTEMLIIEGDITNTSSTTQPLPPLKIRLMNKTSQPVDHWDHSFPIASLPQGQFIHFETAPRPKLPGTQTIAIEF